MMIVTRKRVIQLPSLEDKHPRHRWFFFFLWRILFFPTFIHVYSIEGFVISQYYPELNYKKELSSLP